MNKFLLTIPAVLVSMIAFGAGAPDNSQHVSNARDFANFIAAVHYLRPKIDNQFSSEVFGEYLNTLDPERLYLTDEDVRSAEKYRYTFDEVDTGAWQGPAEQLYSTVLLKMKQQNQYNVDHFQSLRFTESDFWILDRSKAPRPTSNNQEKLWNDYLKYQVLSLRSLGKSDVKIQEYLQKRLTNARKELDEQSQLSVMKKKVFEKYVEAMFSSRDPHSNYFPKDEASFMNAALSAQFYGIGAELKSVMGDIEIVKLTPGGPAAMSGLLHPGDHIVSVVLPDKKIINVSETPMSKAIEYIKGPKGSVVTLNIIPKGSTQEKQIQITRGEVKLPRLETKIMTLPEANKNYRVGVITIPSFYGDQGKGISVAQDLKNSLIDLNKEHIDGLVVDLQNNPGGSLDEVVDMVSYFVDKGPIVYSATQQDATKYLDTYRGKLYSGPLVVIVNHGSASAAEIFAGAIKDYRRGLVVGQDTFGKGSVQGYRPLPYSLGAFALTESMFFRPLGWSAQLIGVAPDVYLPMLESKDFGERFQDHPLPKNKINVSKVVTENDPNFLGWVRLEKSSDRWKDNSGFNLISELSQLDQHFKKQKSVSLVESKFISLDQEINQKKLAIINRYRAHQGLAPLTSARDWDMDGIKEVKGIEQQAAARMVVDYHSLSKGGSFGATAKNAVLNTSP